jgi:50S ribosomal protein L16 3-hydroxylase
MGGVSRAFVGDLTIDEFRAEYWRRRPLCVRGGGHDLIDFRVPRHEFERLTTRLAVTSPMHVRRRCREITFVENVSQASERLQRRARALGEALGCPSVWVDGVLARDGCSIGSHYDDSDNFIVQQSGEKLWRLHDPSIIPVEHLRRRMLGDPTVAAVEMPDDCLEFVLEPGDLLYIPLFWAHDGISRGPSFSLTLVCNATSALAQALPRLIERLAQDPWWWRPIPAGAQIEEDELVERLGTAMSREHVPAG